MPTITLSYISDPFGSTPSSPTDCFASSLRTEPLDSRVPGQGGGGKGETYLLGRRGLRETGCWSWDAPAQAQ